MKVDIVNLNNQKGVVAQNNTPKRQLAQRGAYLSSAPSFTGAKLSAIQEMILKLMPKGEQRWFNILNKIQDYSKGEMGGIVITAAGTGLVAPLPIAFNPFVKAAPNATEEEKAEVRRTKQYTAWRQPISAVLAILIQASVQKPIDKFLQKLTNDEDTAKCFKNMLLNQTSLTDEKYLERKLKKDNSLLKDIDIIDDAGNPTGTKRKETIEEAKARIIEKQKSNIIESLKKDGTIKMGKFTIKNADVAQIINNNIDDYIRAANDLKIPKDKVKEHLSDAADFIENEKTLRNILGKDKLDALPRVSEGVKDIDPKALKDYIIECRKSAPNEAVEDILTKIINQCDAVRESNCIETINRIDKIHDIMGGPDKRFDLDKYRRYLKEKNETIRKTVKELEALKFGDLSNVEAKNIQETITKLIDTCHIKDEDPKKLEKLKLIFKDNGAFLSDPEALGKKVYNDVVACYKELVGHRFSLFKQLTKVCVGVLVTLPITCTALNWIYPRFMELFFPNLAGIKKDSTPKQNVEGGEQ